MIVEYVRYNVGAERAESFLAAYGQAAASLDASPHCVAYDLARCDEEPGRFILRIEWDSAEGHMQGFRRGPDFPPFFAAVRPFVGDLEEMRHYTPTGIAGRADAPLA